MQVHEQSMGHAAATLYTTARDSGAASGMLAWPQILDVKKVLVEGFMETVIETEAETPIVGVCSI